MSLYDDGIKRRAQELLTGMSLREKIGQMVQFNARNVAIMREKYSFEEIGERFPYGSFFSGVDVIGLVGQRMKGLEAVTESNRHLRIPLLVSGDLENGAGGEPMPPQLVLGATRDLDLAYDFGRVIARRGRSEGFHWTFAPVADIIVNWMAPAIGVRALGSDPKLVADMCCSIIRGMQDNGLCATIKHFPGDGVDFRNQHIGVALDDMTRKEWDDSFGMVYRRCFAEGVRSVMAGHIGLPCVDDRNFPAVLSDRLSTGLLRDELGFDGVLVSDALIMSGFVSYRTYEKRMIAMVNAGIDVMLWPEEDIFDLVEKAVSWGDIPVERIDEATRRVLEMKFASGVMDKAPLPDDLPEEEYASVSNRIAEKGTVLVMDRNNVLPLKQGEVKKALVVISDLPDKLAAMAKPEEDKRFRHIFQGLRERGVSDIEIKLGGNCLDLLDAELKGARYDAVIYIFAEAQPYGIRPSVASLELVWQMSNTIVHNAVAISLYTPYISKENPITPAAVINACSSCPASQRAAVKLMFGEIPFQGRSSVDLGVDYHSIGEWDKIEYKSLAKEN